MDIRNQVILITGGASGLGAGTARALTAQGARVVLADVQDETGRALAAELGQTYIHCDVTAETDAQAAVDAATAQGTLRGLVNCAGIAPASRIVGKTGPHDLVTGALLLPWMAAGFALSGPIARRISRHTVRNVLLGLAAAGAVAVLATSLLHSTH